VFRERLPGLYIPSLPPKKIIGNTKYEFLEERSFHLEQFLKKVYKLPYLLESEELEIFGRDRSYMIAGNNFDVGERLSLLEKQNTALLAYRVKQVAPSGERQPSPKDLYRMHGEIMETRAFCKRHNKFLEGLRDLLRTFSDNVEVLVSSEHAVCQFLKAYERQHIASGEASQVPVERKLSVTSEEQVASLSSSQRSSEANEDRDRFKTMFGLKTEHEENRREVLHAGMFNFTKANLEVISRFRNPFKILYFWCV